MLNSYCIFYHNLDEALFVNATKENTKVVLEDCIINYGDYGIEVEGLGSVAMNKTIVSNQINQGISVGAKGQLLMNECELLDCGGGIVMIENSKVMAVESKINNNEEMGILVSDDSEISIYNCDISENLMDGLAVFNKGQATVFETKFSANKVCGISVAEASILNLHKSKIFHNDKGIGIVNVSSIFMDNSQITNNKEYDLYQSGKSESHIEKSTFYNEGHGLPDDTPLFVGVIVAEESNAVFVDCDFSTNQWDEAKLTMSADKSMVTYKNCSFHDAQDGIGVFDNSQCTINNCKFNNIQNLEVKMQEEKDSKLKLADTKLSDKTMSQFKKVK